MSILQFQTIVIPDSDSNSDPDHFFPLCLIRDRFGPEESDNGSAAGTSQSFNQGGNTQTGNAQYGNGQFPGAGQFGNGAFGSAPFGNAPNVPVFSGGHFSSVSGQYDPNTQQTVIYHNYNQKLK